MSEHLKSARKSMKDKLARYLDKSEGPVDASGYEVPGFLKVGVKTGARPVSRSQYKRGGKVTAEAEGAKAKHHAGRKSRKSGGSALTANSYINRNQREANDEREGEKHIGAYKRGGRAKRADGGLMGPGMYGLHSEPTSSRVAKAAGLKRGGNAGRKHRDFGGNVDQDIDGGDVMDMDAPNDYDNDYSMAAGAKKKKAPPPPPPRPKKKMTDIYPNEPYEPMPKRGPDTETTPYGFKRGGKAKKFEDSPRDMREDKKLEKKYGMSHKEWEASELDEKHDRQGSMKGLKKGGRTGKSFGGDLALGLASPIGLAASKMIGGGKKDDDADGKKRGGEVAHPDGCRCDRCMGGSAKKRGGSLSVTDGSIEGTRPTGGRLARKSGGRAKGKTNINIVIATGKSPQDQMGGLGPQPGMPPAPPLGRPVPMPPAGGPPGAGAPMPMPMPMPAGGPPAGAPPMGRKFGGRSNHGESRTHYKK